MCECVLRTNRFVPSKGSHTFHWHDFKLTWLLFFRCWCCCCWKRPIRYRNRITSESQTPGRFQCHFSLFIHVLRMVISLPTIPFHLLAHFSFVSRTFIKIIDSLFHLQHRKMFVNLNDFRSKFVDLKWNIRFHFEISRFILIQTEMTLIQLKYRYCSVISHWILTLVASDIVNRIVCMEFRLNGNNVIVYDNTV